MSIQFIEIMLAAFGGTFAAFAIEAYRRHRQTIAENANKGNQVLFRLQQNWNSMAQFQRDVIDPVRDNPSRGILMERMQELELYEKIEIGNLDFLTGRFPETVHNVLIEDERYRTNIRAINERSELMLEDIQKPMGNAGIKNGSNVTQTQLISIVGERAFTEVSLLTDRIINNVDSAVDSSMNIQTDLRAKLRYTCPGKPFITYQATNVKGR